MELGLGLKLTGGGLSITIKLSGRLYRGRK
jgi:hypothetical protein